MVNLMLPAVYSHLSTASVAKGGWANDLLVVVVLVESFIYTFKLIRGEDVRVNNIPLMLLSVGLDLSVGN